MARFLMLLLVSIGAFCLAACGPADEEQGSDHAPITTLQQVDDRVVVPTFTATSAVVLRPTPTPILSHPTEQREPTTRPRLKDLSEQVTKQNEALGVAIINTALLNVRSAPNTNASIITTLSSGDCQTVKAAETDWYLLLLDDGREGWSAAEYLTPNITCPTRTQARATTSPVTLTRPQKGVVNAPSLNVRSGPGAAFGVLTQIAANNCVDVLTAQDGWVQIAKDSDVVGWCSQEFVTLVERCPAIVQQVEVAVPVAAPAPPVQPVSYVGQPFAPNATTIKDAYIFECFGSGTNELRFVTASTPVQVLGTGAFRPPYAELGSGPFLKIRIWDGQFAWIAAGAVTVDLATQPAVSAQCESYDRLDWSTIVPPTPTSYPSWVTNPTPSQPTGCCKICRKGKACGDSCISASYTCHKGPGCACNG